MFHRILVPFDGSLASNRGLEEAIKLAAGQPVTQVTDACCLRTPASRVEILDLDADAVTNCYRLFPARHRSLADGTYLPYIARRPGRFPNWTKTPKGDE